nr:hypothetical protein HK105_006724 [Polyrhizophydium stewartii]
MHLWTRSRPVPRGSCSGILKTPRPRWAQLVRTAALPMCTSMQPSPLISAAVDQTQFDNIMARINEAKRDPSIRLVTGGERRGTTGYFVQPTIFADVDDAAPLAVHEVFGPVLAVLKPFDSIEEAVRRANSSVYGLAAGLWTNNLRSSQYATKHLRAGMIWINNYNDTPVYMPFGGLKQSGYGKDLGEEALDGFTVLKSVHSARE